MIQAGKNITQVNDQLIKIQVEYLYHAIKSPKPELEAEIRQLRMVRTLDVKRYTQLKRGLPYVVCGIFNPPIRKGENFAWITHFILDFDHLAEKGVSVESLKVMLSEDPYVVLMFVSPGDDGLKVLFRLCDKCFDRGKYSLFYKLFSRKFANQYQLNQVIDSSTSDVTRACFLSVDPNAYYNPEALAVDINKLIDFEDREQVTEHIIFLQKEEKLQKRDIIPIAPNEAIDRQQLEEGVLEKIKLKLNPNCRLKKEKQILVPEQIEKVIELVVARMKALEIETTETINIHYGKKFKFQLGKKQSEINLFYGKRGFTVVVSPRSGTDEAFNEITARIIGELLV